MVHGKQMHFVGAFAAASAVSAATYAAGVVEVIYSEIAGHPTAQVPGAPIGTEFTSFDRPYQSPDGSRWIISAFGAAPAGEVIILGSGTAGNVVVDADTPSGFGAENWGPTDRNLAVNDAGQFAFVNNTDGPTPNDDKTVLFDGANFVLVTNEGGEIPGFTPAEAVVGLSNAVAGITTDGVVGVLSPSSVGTLGTTNDDFIMSGNGGPLAVLLQTGVDIPGNQAGGTMLTWETFDSQDHYISADGLHYIIQGDLSGAVADDVIVVDDNVVLQEDNIVPGSGFADPINIFVEPAMISNGDWYAQGNNDGGLDWIVRNGDVITTNGEPIVTGAAETFSDAPFASTFFVMTGNNLGHHAIGGTTSEADPLLDAVIVCNDRVILRQSDPVDLNGNGVDDDDVFINIFNNYDSFLTDDGWYYFTADLFDGAQASLGQGFLRVRAFVPGDVNDDLTVDVFDVLDVLNDWGACEDPCPPSCDSDITNSTGTTRGDCNVDVFDLLLVLDNWS